jgi:hypothetical protein
MPSEGLCGNSRLISTVFENKRITKNTLFLPHRVPLVGYALISTTAMIRLQANLATFLTIHGSVYTDVGLHLHCPTQLAPDNFYSFCSSFLIGTCLSLVCGCCWPAGQDLQ